MAVGAAVAVGMDAASAVGTTVTETVGPGVAVGVGRTGVAVAADPHAKAVIENARTATAEVAGGQLIMPEFYQYLAVPTPCKVYRPGTRWAKRTL